jgi:chemotaxis protein methyltransferase CheR
VLLVSRHCLTQEEFQRLSDAVYDHCGINLHQGKKELVDARLVKLLRASHFQSVGEYIDFVVEHQQDDEFYALIDALSTNVTNFFREMGHFDYLAKVFLPALLNKKQKLHQTRIRGWSAACSSGEEAYSIAMTLLDALPERTHVNVKILATDISNNVLTEARRGVYERARTAAVPASLRSKYLIASVRGHEIVYELSDVVRQVVQFAYLNLMERWPFNGPFDFIFCRNVMIYFDKPTQQRLVNRFYDLLDGGGMLFTGHSESLAGISHKFHYVRPTIYVKA